jgi:hypothetical protein
MSGQPDASGPRKVVSIVGDADSNSCYSASSLLKKGTGSEPLVANAAKNAGCEVPVPLFQQAAGAQCKKKKMHPLFETAMFRKIECIPVAGKEKNGDCPNFRVSENGTVPFAAENASLTQKSRPTQEREIADCH